MKKDMDKIRNVYKDKRGFTPKNESKVCVCEREREGEREIECVFLKLFIFSYIYIGVPSWRSYCYIEIC